MRAALVALLCLALVAPAAAWPRAKVHRYKVVTGDGGTSVLSGTKIRTRGFCVEVILNGRVDTIACGIKYITELPDEAPEDQTPLEPTEPAITPQGTGVAVTR